MKMSWPVTVTISALTWTDWGNYEKDSGNATFGPKVEPIKHEGGVWNGSNYLWVK